MNLAKRNRDQWSDRDELSQHHPTFIRKQEQSKSGGASFIPFEHWGLWGTLLLPSNSLLLQPSLKSGPLNKSTAYCKKGTILLIVFVAVRPCSLRILKKCQLVTTNRPTACPGQDLCETVVLIQIRPIILNQRVFINWSSKTKMQIRCDDHLESKSFFDFLRLLAYKTDIQNIFIQQNPQVPSELWPLRKHVIINCLKQQKLFHMLKNDKALAHPATSWPLINTCKVAASQIPEFKKI